MPFEFGADDWNDAAPPKNFDPIPSGVYRYVITGAEAGRTNDGTKDKLDVTLQVEGGDYDGRLIFDTWVMPDKALQTPDKFKESMGFLKERITAVYDATPTGDFRINPGDMLGRRGAVQVGIKADARPAEKGGGFYDPKNNVKRYIATSDPAFNTPSPTASSQPAGLTPNTPQPQNGTAPETAGAAPTSAFRL